MIGNYTGSRGELNFERDFIDALISSGWSSTILKNPTRYDLENNLRQIINENNIAKLDGVPLTDNEFGQIMDHIHLKCQTPVAANVFLNGKHVAIRAEISRKGCAVGDEIYLDVFDPVEIAGGKSRYQIVEQPIFETSVKYNDRRGDILLLINGFPVVEIELKASGIPLEEGVNQIQKYMNEGVYIGLYSLIQVFFVATPEDVIYFANSFPKLDPAFMFHWGNIENKPVHDWHSLILGPDQLLSIPEAHQLIGYYTTASVRKDSNGCIENINNGTLMAARSYQVHAIRAILRRVKLQRWGEHTPLGGYIWGTTGCGKTLTSYKAGQLVTDKAYADKVVFVVDRVELSDQSFDEYNSFARDGEPIKKAKNTYNLFKMLCNDKDRLIITSIQKLSRVNETKSKYVENDDITKINKKRILFLIDEAHRSQFGEMHERIKNTFTHALFIGFTGTPIFSENDKVSGMTSKTVFGDCLAVYSIASGIRDKNVLGFDPKMIRTYDDNALRNVVACDKAKVSSAAEAKNDPDKWKIYQRYHRMSMTDIEGLLPTAQYHTLEHHAAVVKDILENWDVLSGGRIRFHALLATDSIPEAVEYYRLFKENVSAKKKGLKVTALFDPSLYGNSGNIIDKEKALTEIVEDYNQMFGTGNIINRDADPQLRSFKSDVTARLAHKGSYKNIVPEDVIDIVIVVDQLLTGFDSKYVNTLYLDKVLDTDALIQAISRTNRVLDFDEKPFGIFRYYRKPYTMEQNITNALRLYCEGGEDAGVIVQNIDENLIAANVLFDEIERIFTKAGVRDFMNLPRSDADCQKFKALFRELKKTIKGMKLQGMKAEDDGDPYVQKLSCFKKWIDGKTRFFDILSLRYSDLKIMRNVTHTGAGKAAYDLNASLSEVEMEKIDADYLEEHFKITVVKLSSDIDEMEKNQIVREFEKQLTVLSVKQQKYALAIIKDIRSDILKPKEKSLKELIAVYEAREIQKKLNEFASRYGADITLLEDLYKNGENDIKISNLLDHCDKEKVCEEFGCKWFVARGKLNSKVREFLRG